jgi:hypothetical protein
MAFVNVRNVIMVNDNTGADNRHRYEKAAAEEIFPGHVLSEGGDDISIAGDQTEGIAIADLKTYASPVAGVTGDMQPYAIGDLVRFLYPLAGDIVRIKSSGISLTAGNKVDITDGEVVLAAGTLAPFGLVLEHATTGDSHVVIRVL